jgi:hypothetical protein
MKSANENRQLIAKSEIGTRQLLYGSASHQLHVAFDLSAHDTEGPLDTGSPCGSEWKKIVTANAYRLGAQ